MSDRSEGGKSAVSICRCIRPCGVITVNLVFLREPCEKARNLKSPRCNFEHSKPPQGRPLCAQTCKHTKTHAIHCFVFTRRPVGCKPRTNSPSAYSSPAASLSISFTSPLCPPCFLSSFPILTSTSVIFYRHHGSVCPSSSAIFLSDIPV